MENILEETRFSNRNRSRTWNTNKISARKSRKSNMHRTGHKNVANTRRQIFFIQ